LDRDAARRQREERAVRLEARRAVRSEMARSGGAREMSSWLDAM
jgi:hypothetical protein